MISVGELDSSSAQEASDYLQACCGSTRWVNAMVSMRPFKSAENAYAQADEAWSHCTKDDWLEAFSHHPRIGEKKAEGWAAGEQSGAHNAAASVQEKLAQINRVYEEKFGHIYIVCATGRSAEEMLAIARARMANDADAELRIAAEEQRKIMQLRLRKLFGDNR